MLHAIVMRDFIRRNGFTVACQMLLLYLIQVSATKVIGVEFTEWFNLMIRKLILNVLKRCPLLNKVQPKHEPGFMQVLKCLNLTFLKLRS